MNCDGMRLERMPRLRLDHLTVIAPSLAEGVDHVRACLGLDNPPSVRKGASVRYSATIDTPHGVKTLS